MQCKTDHKSNQWDPISSKWSLCILSYVSSVSCNQISLIISTCCRFEEVAELIAVCWLNIVGSIERRDLSPNTKYAAYLVFRLADESYGLDCPTQEARIATGDQVATRRLSMYPRTTQAREGEQGGRAEDESTVSYPREREDDWMEVELGEFYNHQGDTGVVGFSLVEHVQLHWKKGLMLEGIEIRQKN